MVLFREEIPKFEGVICKWKERYVGKKIILGVLIRYGSHFLNKEHLIIKPMFYLYKRNGILWTQIYSCSFQNTPHLCLGDAMKKSRENRNYDGVTESHVSENEQISPKYFYLLI